MEMAERLLYLCDDLHMPMWAVGRLCAHTSHLLSTAENSAGLDYHFLALLESTK